MTMRLGSITTRYNSWHNVWKTGEVTLAKLTSQLVNTGPVPRVVLVIMQNAASGWGQWTENRQWSCNSASASCGPSITCQSGKQKRATTMDRCSECNNEVKREEGKRTMMVDLPTVLLCFSRALDSFLWDTICSGTEKTEEPPSRLSRPSSFLLRKKAEPCGRRRQTPDGTSQSHKCEEKTNMWQWISSTEQISPVISMIFFPAQYIYIYTYICSQLSTLTLPSLFHQTKHDFYIPILPSRCLLVKAEWWKCLKVYCLLGLFIANDS